MPRPVGYTEHQLVSVLLATSEPPVKEESTPTLKAPGCSDDWEGRESLLQELQAHGARATLLASNSLVATFLLERGTASDQAAMGAHCALLVKERWPESLVALTTGLSPRGRPLPVGEAMGPLILVGAQGGSEADMLVLHQSIVATTPEPDAISLYMQAASMLALVHNWHGQPAQAAAVVERMRQVSSMVTEHDGMARGWLYCAYGYFAYFYEARPWRCQSWAEQGSQAFRGGNRDSSTAESRAEAEQGVRTLEQLGETGAMSVATWLALAEACFAQEDMASGDSALREALRCVRLRASDIPEGAARERFLSQVPENARVQELARQRWEEPQA
jgi:hypothetical protein